MDGWVWWIVAAGVLAVADVVTGGTLILIMIAGGAAAGGLASALGASPALSVGVFALVSVALLGSAVGAFVGGLGQALSTPSSS